MICNCPLSSSLWVRVEVPRLKTAVMTLPPTSGSEDPGAHFANPPADANDESLQKYKESLGLGGGKDLSDPNDPRVCIILALTMESPGRDPVRIDLSQPGSELALKDKPFKIKEGSKFTMVATFKVQHEILSGLHYVQIVKRKGIRVSKDSEMIVCFPFFYQCRQDVKLQLSVLTYSPGKLRPQHRQGASIREEM